MSYSYKDLSREEQLYRCRETTLAMDDYAIYSPSEGRPRRKASWKGMCPYYLVLKKNPKKVTGYDDVGRFATPEEAIGYVEGLLRLGQEPAHERAEQLCIF